MQVKYPLCQELSLEFRFAILDLIYGHDPENEKELTSARAIATVDGLIWG